MSKARKNTTTRARPSLDADPVITTIEKFKIADARIAAVIHREPPIGTKGRRLNAWKAAERNANRVYTHALNSMLTTRPTTEVGAIILIDSYLAHVGNLGFADAKECTILLKTIAGALRVMRP